MMQGLFPTDLDGWFSLFLKAAGVLSSLWALAVVSIRRPLISKLNGLGDRVKKVEVCEGTLEGRVTSLERVDERHNFQVTLMAERQGKLEGRQDKLEDAATKALSEIREQLGRIDERTKLMVSHLTKEPE